MKGTHTFSVWMLVAIATLAGPAAARNGAGELAHEQLARAFVEEVGGERPEAEAPPLRALLAERFVRLPVGAFELSFPAAQLEDADGAQQLRRVTLALLDAQHRWSEWTAAGERGAGLRAELEALRDHVEGWTPKQLAQAAGSGGELLDLLGAGAELRRFALEARDELRALAPGAPKGQLPVRMMLLPTRELFVEFLCYAGWSRPSLRGTFWVAGVETWTHTFLDDLQVYAMEYASNGGRWDEGTSMDRQSQQGLEQQMVQLAMGDLFEKLYGGALPASFVGGVSTNLVIDLFGEVDTRVDGDLVGRTTDARETFVPGGLSYGGVLPKNRADSRWREQLGAGYFVEELRAAQKAGKKAKRLAGTRSPNPMGSFVLEPNESRERYVVGAPILGPGAVERSSPPPPFDGEYQEFLRAYRSAFLHWLRTSGAGKEEPSQAAFAELFGALAAGGADLDPVFVELYGAPLSNAEADDDSLEGRFLDWLAKKRGR